jgi:hypothetical protein
LLGCESLTGSLLTKQPCVSCRSGPDGGRRSGCECLRWGASEIAVGDQVGERFHPIPQAASPRASSGGWMATPPNGACLCSVSLFRSAADRRPHAAPSTGAYHGAATRDELKAADHRCVAGKGDRSSAVAGHHNVANNLAVGRSTEWSASNHPRGQRYPQELLVGLPMPIGMHNQQQQAQKLRPLSSTCYLPR